ncbi:hypothetical protein C8Q80DRAFT_430416 [Daedaleopsis nitida]|nr:hypothetical protein C8Q80DRAFT_430416 [Daedaleopsis nitida]
MDVNVTGLPRGQLCSALSTEMTAHPRRKLTHRGCSYTSRSTRCSVKTRTRTRTRGHGRRQQSCWPRRSPKLEPRTHVVVAVALAVAGHRRVDRDACRERAAEMRGIGDAGRCERRGACHRPREGRAGPSSHRSSVLRVGEIYCRYEAGVLAQPGRGSVHDVAAHHRQGVGDGRGGDIRINVPGSSREGVSLWITRNAGLSMAPIGGVLGDGMVNHVSSLEMRTCIYRPDASVTK